MTQRIQDIAYPIASTGFFLLISTILVTDPDYMNGFTIAKYFWFYSALWVAGLVTLLQAFYFKSIASIDLTKSIMIGIMTVVIIDISRNSNMEMMNARIFLLVIISFFFFDIFFNQNNKVYEDTQYLCFENEKHGERETLRHPLLLMKYGYALSQSGLHEKSIEILQQAAQTIFDPIIYNHIGKNFQALGQYQLAELNFQKAHHEHPDMVYPNSPRANLYLQMGLQDKSLEYARQVISYKSRKENSKETQDMKAQM